MKTVNRYWGRLVGLTSVSVLLVAFYIHLARASAPGLNMVLTGPYQASLVVTNGATNGVYEIYFQEFLDGLPLTNGTWLFLDSGTNGQTNFNYQLGDTPTGFFRAVDGNDFDSDGIANPRDARPFDPSIGLLTVTIEKPANGANVQ